MTSESSVPRRVLEVAEALSSTLGVETVVSPEVSHPDNTVAYAIRLVDKEALFPRLKSGNTSAVVVLYGKDDSFTKGMIRLLLGDEVIADEQLRIDGCSNALCVASAVAEMMRNKFPATTLRLLDEAMDTLKSAGMNITYKRYLRYFGIEEGFYVSALTDDKDISVTLKIGDDVNAIISVLAKPVECLEPDEVIALLKKHPALSKYSLGLDINYEESAVDVSVHEVSIVDIPSVIKAVRESVDEALLRVKEATEKIEPVDAASIYLLGLASDGLLYELLYEESRINGKMVEMRAMDYFRNVFERMPSTSAYSLAEELYKRGRLWIDIDGYLVLDGRRMIDAVKKYTHDKLTLEYDNESFNMTLYERNLIEHLMVACGVDVESLVNEMKKIPDRIVEIVIYNAELSNKYFTAFIKSPETWARLSYESRVKILASRPEVIDEARANSWTWVFEDPYVVARAVTISKEKPAEATKVLIELFPEFIGSRFEVVYAGGEPFVKLGNVVLQVRRVFKSGVEVHGTVGTSTIGMVARGRSVANAARAISESLVDAVTEFRELAETMHRDNSNIELSKYATPLFNVPVVIVKNPDKNVEIPLQPRLSSVLRRLGVAVEENEKVPA